ncbi:MAG: ATP-dependent DNA helicase RecG [Negativicutes bacterium]
MQQWLFNRIETLKGVGAKTAEKLAELKLVTLQDLLHYFPRTYLDYSQLKQVRDLQAGEFETCQVSMVRISSKSGFTGKGKKARSCILVSDDTGSLEIVSFNPYIKYEFRVGRKILISGKIKKTFNSRYIQMENPVIEDAEASQHLRTGRIVPVYGGKKGLPKNLLRSLIFQILSLYSEHITECIPADIIASNDLMVRADAYWNIHFPQNADLLDKARKRLIFEELFLLQCGLLSIKEKNRKLNYGIKHAPDGQLVCKITEKLPFSLTDDQQRVLQEIKSDMEDIIPMRRLVQGDVGSGKTAVAAIALAKTVENGYQGALMAPTEILAQQHFQTLAELFSSFGCRVALLSARLSRKERGSLLDAIRNHQVDIVVGTHALIQEDIDFSALGLAITDEQHRFGVEQRARLKAKGDNADVLVMTATPIPRTLALTVYGDLDVSIIHHLPPGRKPVRTLLYGLEKREEIYAGVLRQIALGHQVYVVCPLVEENENIDARSVHDVHAELSATWLRGVSCGLIHGRLAPDQKDHIMQAYYQGDISVLISTTVIEVGVNVPNATVMVIENAERFGLAQLHQLRGRIGRGGNKSFCVLISDIKQQNIQERLAIMTECNNGLLLAEKDLQLRGPGQFFGHRQHGLPDLKLADIIGDMDVLLLARRSALDVVQEGEMPLALQKAIERQFAI